jgi:uncharacterized protein (DUF488 family)
MHESIRILTVGHGTRPIEAFLELLASANVERLVDIRTAPGSRRHPQFGHDSLAASLHDAGIAYEWAKDLGGFRKARADSRHTALRNSGFRGYADYMETREFLSARDRLIDTSRERTTAVMCAESVWWRCHRRMLSDSLTVAGCEVRHIMEGGRLEPHRLTDAARVVGGVLVYDVGQQDLLAT